MRRRLCSGFSLVELAVVLFILSVAFAILLPRLPGLEGSRRDAALRRLSGAVQALHEEALFKKKSLALIYDLEEQRYLAGAWDDEQADYLPGPGLPVGEVQLSEDLRFRDVETSLDGVVTSGRALTRFLPQGYSTPTWIHLEDRDGEPYTLVVHPLLGRAEIFDERIDAP